MDPEPQSIQTAQSRFSSLVQSLQFVFAVIRLFPKWFFARVQHLGRNEPSQFNSVWAESVTPLWVKDVSRSLQVREVGDLRKLTTALNGARVEVGQALSVSRELGLIRFEKLRRSNAYINLISEIEGVLNFAQVQFTRTGDDLCFSAESAPLVLETWMTPTELIVRLRSDRANENASNRYAKPRVAPESIEEVEIEDGEAHFKTAALLDQYAPEFDTYLSGELIDLYFVPLRSKYLSKYRWHVPSGAELRTAWWITLKRMFAMMRARRLSKHEAETKLHMTELLAKSYMRRLPDDVEHIITSQDFLPFLWKEGALQGRTFDVLMTRPALSVVRAKLQEGAWLMPNVDELREFRVQKEIVASESEALVYSDRVITPHEEFAKLYPNLRKLEWAVPQVQRPADVPRPRAILFPTSLAAREGAHAVLAASDEFEVPLYVVGSDPEGLTAESDLVQFVSREEIPWNEIAVVAHPTLFESWPRLHLEALALEVPVIVSEGAGLPEGEGVMLVSFGDEEGIKRAIERVLEKAGVIESFSRDNPIIGARASARAREYGKF